ncbi:MAG: hypothetical protein AMJ61_13075 [Desulfobacterales bacterium SG8_35_2]|nr:MAG: hypothetical protein AMJ61_13075 [Desulfobacterales bacterium SG8_35_2]
MRIKIRANTPGFFLGEKREMDQIFLYSAHPCSKGKNMKNCGSGNVNNKVYGIIFAGRPSAAS